MSERVTDPREMLRSFSNDMLLAEISRLKQALAAAEAEKRASYDAVKQADGHAATERRKAERLRARAESAEARVRELEASR